MIKSLLESFQQREGYIGFKAEPIEVLSQVDNFMEKNGFCSTPKEFKEFLKITDGFSYNGIEFFGTNYHYREEKKYYFPDIISINKHYLKYDFFSNKMIIGRLSESLLVYSKNSNTFSIIDRVKLRTRTEFDTLSSLLHALFDLC